MTTIDWKNASAEHFEKHASGYLLPVYPWLLNDFNAITGQSATGLKILEIGCGPGFMLQQFAQQRPKILVGLDRSMSMLKSAISSGRSQNAQLIHSDACNLPFADSQFDAVFSRGSVFFWSDLKSAFASIKCCLKPGGQALIGGGYGLSTPQHLIDALGEANASRSKDDIPRLDLDDLTALADGLGGHSRILQARKRGFWLHWKL